MPDHQRDWLAILAQAQRRHDIYSRVIIATDTDINNIIGRLGPRGEATDQLVQMGLDLINGAPGSNVAKDVIGLCREGSRTHNQGIAHLTQARNAISRALTQNVLAVARIQDAIGGIGGI